MTRKDPEMCNGLAHHPTPDNFFLDENCQLLLGKGQGEGQLMVRGRSGECEVSISGISGERRVGEHQISI